MQQIPAKSDLFKSLIQHPIIHEVRGIGFMLAVEMQDFKTVKAVIDEALVCKRQNKSKCIVFNLSGHGHFDLSAYDAYFNGKLEDFEHPDKAIAEALTHLPDVKE